MHKLASLGLALAVVMASRDSAAFELKHTASGLPLEWQQAQVTFVVDPSIEAAVPGGAAAVAGAVAAWSGVGGAPQLVTLSGPGGAKVAVDGQNSILLAPDGYAPAGNALAVTVVSYDDATGALVDTDIVVNGIHAFAVLAASSRGAPGAAVSIDAQPDETAGGASFDLEHVVAHEVGHALGLGDVEKDDAVMYAFTKPMDASDRAPLADDASGLAALYDTAHPGCGQASLAGLPRVSSDVWATVVIVGGVAVGVRTRRASRRK